MKKCIVLLVFISVVLASCDEPRGNFSKTTFNRERQLWLEQDMQNYSFLIAENSPSDSIHATMYIIDGILAGILPYYWAAYEDKVILITDNGEGPPLTGKDHGGIYVPKFGTESITQLYEVIERRVNDAGWRDTIEIHYDSEWHYPSYFCRDFAEGGFIIITIDKFVPNAEIPE